MSPSKHWILLLVLSGTAVATARGQTTWYVDGSGTPPGSGTQADPYTSIQLAIAQASTVDGDTVLVRPGTYVETIHYLAKDIVVRSSGGPSETRIEGGPGDPVVVTLAGLGTLEGFEVVRSAAPATGDHGIALPVVGGFPEIRRCIVRGHDKGIANTYDALIHACTITQNTVGIDDVWSGAHYVENSIVRGNSQWDIRSTTSGNSILRYTDYHTLSSASGCTLPGLCVGTIDADPRFWGAAGGDFRLRPDSPCIDTGDPASPLDPDGSRIDMGALTFDPAYAPGTAQGCFGAEDDCPCGNAGSGAGGCDIAQGTGGIVLAPMNFTPNGVGGGTVELVGSGYPIASQPGVTLIRSTGAEFPPVVFGDGLRCIALPTTRINATLASGGTSLSPVSHGAGAGTFHYQVWVRNQPAGFCTPDAFNLSNAVSIVW